MSVFVQLFGGFANQAIQYLAASKLALEQGTDVVVDLSFLNSQSEHQGFTMRSYMLDKLQNPPKTCDNPPADCEVLPWEVNECPKTDRNIRIQGYFQRLSALPDRYTSCGLLKVYLPSNATKEITDGPMSIGIHVRRGDYVSNPSANAFHGVCSLDYYMEALDHTKREQLAHDKAVCWIATDDERWCRDHLVPRLKRDFLFISNLTNNDVEEWDMLSNCDVGIMANSSYSWLAAYVSGHNEWIYPRDWRTGSGRLADHCPEAWICI
jgi:hypothetical protein